MVNLHWSQTGNCFPIPVTYHQNLFSFILCVFLFIFYSDHSFWFQEQNKLTGSMWQTHQHSKQGDIILFTSLFSFTPSKKHQITALDIPHETNLSLIQSDPHFKRMFLAVNTHVARCSRSPPRRLNRPLSPVSTKTTNSALGVWGDDAIFSNV